MVSKAKIAANARYNAKTYEVVQCRVLKSERLNECIQLAVDNGKARSKADYILQAIKARLRYDGIIGDE